MRMRANFGWSLVLWEPSAVFRYAIAFLRSFRNSWKLMTSSGPCHACSFNVGTKFKLFLQFLWCLMVFMTFQFFLCTFMVGGVLRQPRDSAERSWFIFDRFRLSGIRINISTLFEFLGALNGAQFAPCGLRSPRQLCTSNISQSYVDTAPKGACCQKAELEISIQNGCKANFLSTGCLIACVMHLLSITFSSLSVPKRKHWEIGSWGGVRANPVL